MSRKKKEKNLKKVGECSIFYLIRRWCRYFKAVNIFLLERTAEEHSSGSSSESLSDFEELSDRNQSYLPYRDQKKQTMNEMASGNGDTVVAERSGASAMEPELIRKKVRQSLAKKQQKARRTKRGEAGIVTSKRRENRSVVEQNDDGIW